MIAYHIQNKDAETVFLKAVSEAVKETKEKTVCQCPLCKTGKIEIIQSTRIKNYLCAICDTCGAGAFN